MFTLSNRLFGRLSLLSEVGLTEQRRYNVLKAESSRTDGAICEGRELRCRALETQSGSCPKL